MRCVGLCEQGPVLWGRAAVLRHLGKVEHCPVGVFAADASRQGYALVDKRLFLPDAWWTDAYAAQRTTCHLPNELG